MLVPTRRWSYALNAMLFLFGCSSPHGSQKAQEQMELGWIERSTLHATQYAWFDTGYAAYNPSLEMLEDVHSTLDSTRFLVVFGTWCSDSKRELPRFFKIIDGLQVPKDHVQLFAVDRSKQQPEGIPQQYKITNVPTIIVLQRGTEVGRIVESPKTTLEDDLLEILGPLQP